MPLLLPTNVQGEKWRKTQKECTRNEKRETRAIDPHPRHPSRVSTFTQPSIRIGGLARPRFDDFSSLSFFFLGSLYVFVDARGDEHDEINHVREPRGLFSM